MIALIGFTALAVDYGMLTADVNQLQRGCDAAALAGVTQLKRSGNDQADIDKARDLAVKVARENNVTVDRNAITFNFVASGSADNYTQITVPATRQRALFFSRIWGVANKTVRRQAISKVAPATSMTTNAVAPIGITWDTCNAYKNDTDLHEITLIRQNKETFARDPDDPYQPDPFVLFDLRDSNGKSGAHMQDQLTGDDVEKAQIGDFDTTLNASLNSEGPKLSDGLDTLFDHSAAAPWNDSDSEAAGIRYNEILAGTSPRSNPRVIQLIVTPSTSSPKNGTFNTEIQGFAPVYIEDWDVEYINNGGQEVGSEKTGGGNSKNTTAVLRMKVRFLPPANLSDGQAGAGSFGDAGGNSSGARVVSLIG